MALDLKTIRLDPHSDAARLFAETRERVFLLEQDGVRYIVTRLDERETPAIRVIEDDDIWRDYDPERIRKALHEVAGTLTDAEAEQLKTAIYRGRDEGTRPLVDE